MTSYRRHVARHPDALSRALRQVRSHSMETGPTRDTVGFPIGSALMKFAEGMTKSLRGASTRMVLHTEMGVWGSSDKVVAYRSKLGGSLWCTECATPAVIRFGIPLTSDDLPDGGHCLKCSRDLLIPPAEAGTSIPPVECPDCSHPHVEGQRCTAATAGPFPCGCRG